MTSPTDPPFATQPQQTARETDEALVARLGLGDEDALRALHHRYAALVFTVAARFVDAATAEEVAQDVFVTLWKKHETFDPARGAFKSWLVQIARRRALNELRRSSRTTRSSRTRRNGSRTGGRSSGRPSTLCPRRSDRRSPSRSSMS